MNKSPKSAKYEDKWLNFIYYFQDKEIQNILKQKRRQSRLQRPL